MYDFPNVSDVFHFELVALKLKKMSSVDLSASPPKQLDSYGKSGGWRKFHPREYVFTSYSDQTSSLAVTVPELCKLNVCRYVLYSY